MIALQSDGRVYLACGYTDMRKGMQGLAMLVQQVLSEDPFNGALYAFRGRRGNLLKLVWHDGIGLHADQTAGAGAIHLALGQHDGPDRVDVGATGRPAGWLRVAGAGARPQTGACGIKICCSPR